MKTTIGFYAFITGALLSKIIASILDNQLQFVAILFVVAFDLVLGVSKALVLPTLHFQTNKAFKGVFKLVSFWVLLAVVLVIEMAYPYVAFLSEAILLPIILFTIISILKSMNQLGLIGNDMLKNMLNRIDRHKDVASEDNVKSDI